MSSSSSSSQEVPDVWVIPWGFSYGDFSLGSRKDVFSRPGEWSPGVTCTLAKTDFSNPSLWRLLPSLLPTGIVRISVRPRLRLARRMNFANWISWCWQWDMQKALGALSLDVYIGSRDSTFSRCIAYIDSSITVGYKQWQPQLVPIHYNFKFIIADFIFFMQ